MKSKGLLRNNGRARRSLMIQGIFGAKLQGHLQRLLLRLFSACRGSLWHSVAAYSPFHCSCSNKFHSTIFPSFLSMDTARRNLKISFSFGKIEILCDFAFCMLFLKGVDCFLGMKSVNWKTWKAIGAENKSRVRGIKWKKDRLFWILQAVNILRKYIGGLEIHFIFPTFMEKIWMHSGTWGVII